ncbi:thermonuclease family protein [Sulfitobacter sp. TSTF-M16]|uniref:Thermonuclease family protein n=1 Tax=Sulfitobacter aestuariivivens TaxID=2766981 RepID=A0A927D0A5_9RHOB|nr:thermonuclease family protein [Sulfitobacter aestuariivivens]MBD3662685.1 thermonuclease family protein [Sulfitobacter aestuariivivens]
MLRIASWCVLCLCLALPARADITGPVRVIDGDTIDVGDTRIRLHGIDAPEREQTCTTKTGQAWGCGDWATRQVRDHFEGLPARCEALDTDRYGRTVARCTVAGHDMGRVLVQAGFALAYRKYSLDYDLDEKAALVSQRGVHGFDMQAPARYREVRRAEMVSRDRQSGLKKKDTPPALQGATCRIKGNISRDGKRIYHMPGQQYYTRTRINRLKGERWFCTEAEARGAGWRRSKV